MSVKVFFNHHYSIGGINYLPGDVADLDESIAAPLLYSTKARLVGSGVPTTANTYETTSGAQQKADEAAILSFQMTMAFLRDYYGGVGPTTDGFETTAGAQAKADDAASTSFDMMQAFMRDYFAGIGGA